MTPGIVPQDFQPGVWSSGDPSSRGISPRTPGVVSPHFPVLESRALEAPSSGGDPGFHLPPRNSGKRPVMSPATCSSEMGIQEPIQGSSPTGKPGVTHHCPPPPSIMECEEVKLELRPLCVYPLPALGLWLRRSPPPKESQSALHAHPPPPQPPPNNRSICCSPHQA